VAGIAGMGCWAGYRLVLRQGRLLLRIEELEAELAGLRESLAQREGMSAGLPRGAVVSNFELPTLSGDRMTLAQWRGRRVALIFVDPSCPFSQRVLTDLAARPVDSCDGRPMPLVVSTGTAEMNRGWIKDHGVRRPILLQEDREVAALYRVDGTPMGYLIDERGVTLSELAVGPSAVLALTDVEVDQAGPVPWGGERPAGRRLITPLPPRPPIVAGGLAVGTPAPAFRLPRLDGGELSLEEYRGRRLLLVFSDPACEPCDALAPALQRAYRRQPRPEMLMISRGEPEANRRQADEHGLSFPIVLQRHWEVSRDYGMLATPIGYLIDERGLIALDVAVGMEAIVALASNPAAARNGLREVLLAR